MQRIPNPNQDAHGTTNDAFSTKQMKIYSKNVSSCSLTILVMDPRIPYLPKADMMYKAALESIGEYAPESACILLQVSSCIMREHLLQETNRTKDTRG